MEHSHLKLLSPTAQLPLLQRLDEIFSQSDFMPHGHCYLWKPPLVFLHVISDTLIGLAYISISLTLYALMKRIKISFNRVIFCFGLFIGACGVTHLLEVWNLWHADYWWSALVKVITAIASVGTGIYLWRLRLAIVRVAEAAKLSEERRLKLEDLTKELEARVRDRTKELEAAVRARDQFLSIASHELKTPLTTLKLLSQMQERKLDRDASGRHEELRSFTNKVNTQIVRLTRLVEDMLDISRIQKGHLVLNSKVQDLSPIVRDVSERFLPQILEVGGSLQLDRCESVLVRVDTFRIEQVLGNLLSNAIKYAPGTRITIGLSAAGKHKVRLFVRDEGPGIPLDARHRIFQRFERAVSENQASGMGLGLFISREIVESHGGRIWSEAGPGPGANFIVELPIVKVS